jgi:hypothetical protein
VALAPRCSTLKPPQPGTSSYVGTEFSEKFWFLAGFLELATNAGKDVKKKKKEKNVDVHSICNSEVQLDSTDGKDDWSWLEAET